MDTPYTALHEAYGNLPPDLPRTTGLRDGYIPDYSHAHCYKDRGLVPHQNLLGFTSAELPAHSRLLVIGSGATRRFERELQLERPDILAIGVDPLLRLGVAERLLESVRMGGTREFGFGKLRPPREIAEGEAYFRKAAIAGGFALAGAKTPRQQDNYLPFQDNTFATVLALHSMPQHLPTENIPALLTEIVRVMEPGGKAMLFPILNEDMPITRDAVLGTAAITGIQNAVLDSPAIGYFDSPGPSEAQRLSFTKAI